MDQPVLQDHQVQLVADQVTLLLKMSVLMAIGVHITALTHTTATTVDAGQVMKLGQPKCPALAPSLLDLVLYIFLQHILKLMEQGNYLHGRC